MKPNNEFTSPENRFFYPVNYEIEHHESLDTAVLPGAENIPGEDHYAVFRNSEGEIKAAELGWSSYSIPVNAVVLGINGLNRTPGIRRADRPILSPEDFGRFDNNSSYAPEEGEDTSMIVQVDLSQFWDEIPDSRFDYKGVAILPHGTPLPSFADGGIPDERVRYRLMGFINPNDKLISWHGETGYTSMLVDWCVANKLKQNRLEEALLIDALPREGHLLGMLSVTEAAKVYLEYFDKKHNTSYLPEEDPRFPQTESTFEPLSDADRYTYRKLADLAHHFMTNPR